MRWALNGPFEIAGYGGIDVWESVLDNLLPVLDNKKTVPETIKSNVKRNHIGLKTGEGFYNYSSCSSEKQVLTQKELLMKLIAPRRSRNAWRGSKHLQ